jgi:hypothetical protein
MPPAKRTAATPAADQQLPVAVDTTSFTVLLQPIDLVPVQVALQTFALLEADLSLHLIERDREGAWKPDPYTPQGPGQRFARYWTIVIMQTGASLAPVSCPIMCVLASQPHVQSSRVSSSGCSVPHVHHSRTQMSVGLKSTLPNRLVAPNATAAVPTGANRSDQ